MYIQTENTPNPDAIKFLPDIEIGSEPIFYNKREEAKASPLALKIFDISGVCSVFYGKNFITVTKESSVEWSLIKPDILTTIMSHIEAKQPIFEDHPAGADNSAPNNENLSEIEQQIVEIIETYVRPSVAADGGDIIYKGFKQGIVFLELRGACSGCPSASITLKNGIESMLKHYIPEVESVEAI